MSRDDSDIIAVRDLPPGLPEPTDESVSRTWHRITEARRPVRSRARTISRILVPAMAAALVAGLAIGGAVVFGDQGAAPVATVPPAPEKPPTGMPGTETPAEPNLAPASPETVAALNALAGAAERGPAATVIRPGKFLYLRVGGWALDGSKVVPADTHERWLDPKDLVTLANSNNGRSANHVDPGTARKALEREGPSLWQPTPEFLASLPTDPDALREALRATIPQAADSSVDDRLWTGLQDFYHITDLLLTPAQRAALLRSFTGLHGLTSSEVTVDGRRLVAIRHTEGGAGDDILFDPATGRAVGMQTATTAQAPETVISSDDGHTLAPGVTAQYLWTQKVVAAAGAR